MAGKHIDWEATARRASERNLIRRFASHYRISQGQSERLLRAANFDWALAFDALGCIAQLKFQALQSYPEVKVN